MISSNLYISHLPLGEVGSAVSIEGDIAQSTVVVR